MFHAPEPSDHPFPSTATQSAVVLFLAGVVQAALWVQIALFTDWIAWPWSLLPWGILLTAAALLYAGQRLGAARSRSGLLGTLAAMAAAITAATWAVFSWWNGVLAPLPLLATMADLLAVAVAAAAAGPIERYARGVRATAPPSDGPPADRRATGVAVTAVAVVGAVVAWGLYAPHSVDRMVTQLALLGTLRWPPSAAGFVETRQEVPYPQSPLVAYAEYEARWQPVDRDEILAFADAITEDVGWAMLRHTGARTVDEAEVALWAADEAHLVPEWIAEALRSRDVFYAPESLLSRSFDPDAHVGRGQIHLDCDQLVHLFVHVAWRLDLTMHEVPAPFHLYVRYDAPGGAGEPLFVETTAFRAIEVSRDRVDMMGEGLGEDFLVPADWFPSGKNGTWATAALTDAAGLYQPLPWRGVEDAIVANVLVGLDRVGHHEPVRAEAEARLDGTRDYVLVSNLHDQRVADAEDALGRDDPTTALAAADAALALRDRFGPLVIDADPADRQARAMALYQLDRKDEACALAAADPEVAEIGLVCPPPL